MEDLTAEELQAILGTDYETVLADILRTKGDALARQHEKAPIGQVGNGHVFFDPAGAINNVMERRRAGKDKAQAQAELQKVLDQQNAGRRTYAEALTRGTPRSVPAQAPGMPPRMEPEVTVQGERAPPYEQLPDIVARPSFLRRLRF